MDYKDIIGIITVVIALISYALYFKDIFSGKTKPHAFSWFIWGLLTAIGFAGQISGNAGAGAWVTGFTALGCFSISLLALKKGGKTNIVLADWLSFIGAMVALLLWYITKSPLLSLILLVVIDSLGFFPTVRKSYKKPYEETVITFFLNGFKFFVSLFALETFSLTTAIYPFYLIIVNWLFVAMLIIRRKQLTTKKLAQGEFS